MAGQLSDSPIQVYCTVKRHELEVRGEGILCTRCQKTLQEVQSGEPVPTKGCGFLRLTTVPLIASALALSSCKDPQQTPEPQPTPPTEEQGEEKEKEQLLPGITHPPEGDDTPISKADYPTAKRVVGRPKLIISPYTGKYIDVEGLPVGSLAMDPTFPPEAKKYFVIPPEAR